MGAGVTVGCFNKDDGVLAEIALPQMVFKGGGAKRSAGRRSDEFGGR